VTLRITNPDILIVANILLEGGPAIEKCEFAPIDSPIDRD